MKTSLATCFSAFLALSQAAEAQDWARNMFPESRHDFGVVARSAKTEYEFKFTNLYVEDVHVSGVRSSCGCTSPRVKDGKATFKTHETGAIVAHINSDTFLGNRGATLTVSIDRPFPAEVQLHVSVQIREDIVLQPGSVQFGSLSVGQAADRQVRVTTPGRADLKIVGVSSPRPYLTAELAPPDGRTGGYLLRVHLSDKAPKGYLDDHLVLQTSDPRVQIPVPVEGVVRSGMGVSPDWLLLGTVNIGEKATRNIVVRSDEPFAITRIIPAAGFECNISAAQTPKLVHVVPVTFTAGTKPGRLAQTLRIETDRANVFVDFVAEAAVVSPASIVVTQHTEPK